MTLASAPLFHFASPRIPLNVHMPRIASFGTHTLPEHSVSAIASGGAMLEADCPGVRAGTRRMQASDTTPDFTAYPRSQVLYNDRVRERVYGAGRTPSCSHTWHTASPISS